VPLEVLLLLVQVDQAVHQALQDQMVLQEYLVLPEQAVHQAQAVRPVLMAYQGNQLVQGHQVQVDQTALLG
jgi:hypothetical protein